MTDFFNPGYSEYIVTHFSDDLFRRFSSLKIRSKSTNNISIYALLLLSLNDNFVEID
jgi:hypothetical protein